MRKEIIYHPPGKYNFHNQGQITVMITGKITWCDGDVYVINRRQYKRIQKHFCGMFGCTCPAGLVTHLDSEGKKYGLKTEWCR